MERIDYDYDYYTVGKDLYLEALCTITKYYYLSGINTINYGSTDIIDRFDIRDKAK